jgi:hypothetical protein
MRRFERARVESNRSVRFVMRNTVPVKFDRRIPNRRILFLVVVSARTRVFVYQRPPLFANPFYLFTTISIDVSNKNNVPSGIRRDYFVARRDLESIERGHLVFLTLRNYEFRVARYGLLTII